MNTSKATIGTKTDVDVRNPAHFIAISTRTLKTLRDLLEALHGDPCLSMLRATAGHISVCLNVPIEQVAIDSLVDLIPRLTEYFQRRRYSRNAIRSYRYYAALLLRRAGALGWIHHSSEIPESWKPSLAAAKKEHGCAGIVHYAIRQGRTPADFKDEDLSAWGEMMLK